ncbi:cystatin [Bombina bombina]|uniref:cystatin n=1 Tax=Bombina bombina TaxID=8345 RepID=UPI00235A95A1|nr:cystatin [Bombina bombina]
MAVKLCLCLSVALSFLYISVSSNILPGGPMNANPDDPSIQKASIFAVNEFNKNSKDDYLCKLIKVMSAQSQVVAGVRYILEVEIGRTQCTKDTTDDPQTCTLAQDSGLTKMLKCQFVVVEVSWLNQETLESYSCNAL